MSGAGLGVGSGGGVRRGNDRWAVDRTCLEKLPRQVDQTASVLGQTFASVPVAQVEL